MEIFTDANFEKEVLKSSIPVVIDFWAEWCGPCRVFSPVIEEVSKEYSGKVKFGKMNVDENEQTAQKYSIMSIPTLLLFKGGDVKATSIGALPKDTVKKWVDKNK